MKKTKILAAIGGLGLAVLSVVLIAADHIDAPAVQGTDSDITDFYAFRAADQNNLAFVVNVQGLLAPGQSTEQAEFNENVLLEINIDNNGDLIEDRVLQAIKRNDSMYFFLKQVSQTGLNSTIDTDSFVGSVKISTVGNVESSTTNTNGMKFFAGPREDPFFFDFTQYNAIIAGTETGFNNPGEDTFEETNVLSVVVEVPKLMIGNGTAGVNPLAPSVPVYSVWVESKRKQ